MKNNIILELKGICRKFSRAKVIDDIFLRLRNVEIYGLVGENSAG